MTPIVRSTVPAFHAHAFHAGRFTELTDASLRGRWSVFFFYPADFTFVCPTELGDLADNAPAFEALGVSLHAVSTDTHFAHKAWHDSSDTIRRIGFPMIGDPTGHLARAFGVYDAATGLAQRGTFVVDPDGVIRLAEVTDDGIGRDARELLRKVQAAIHVAKHPGEVCPAKWTPGAATLAPSLDLVGRI
jgi:peroxiredoxin